MNIHKTTLIYSLSDLALIPLSIFISFTIKGKGYGYFEGFRWYFVIFFLAWILLSVGTRKYQLYEDNYRKSLVKITLTGLMAIGVISFVAYVFTDYRQLSRFIVYGSILFITSFDLLTASALHWLRGLQLVSEPKLTDENKNIFQMNDREKTSVSDEDLPELPPLEENDTPLSETITKGPLSSNGKVHNFLKTHVDLERLSEKKTDILKTRTCFNLKRKKNESLQVVINDLKVNDLKDIDRFFSEVNNNLQTGGYFVGKGITIAEKYNKIINSYPPIINHVVYYLDFLITRAMPKFASLRGVSCFITRGRNKAISKAEILGRLRYSGFKPVALRGIDGYLYFIARKVEKPKRDGDPSYGLLIKLERVGKDGKLFDLYKFRTMHPYSEYIQDYVYEENELDKSGKIKDDFRITTWGKLLRKFYIDEAPQFYNMYKGDINLVGVRALSKHYFNLYPEDLQKRRVKFKPGLVPPYYVHLPQGLDEIVESERRYLSEKEERPLVTDVKYFIFAWRNILFNRSEIPEEL